MASRTPLLTRVGHGVYVPFDSGHGTVEKGALGAEPAQARSAKALATAKDVPAEVEAAEPLAGWPTEGWVQSLVVAYLVREGWHITSVADTASRERGIDIVAHRGDESIGVEVKGYPGRGYADPARRHETKTAHPSAQASAYYAQAILSALRQRHARPQMRAVVAVPDVPRYRSLVGETACSLADARIEVWLVSESGSVEV